LLSVLENQHKLVDAVDFVFDALDQRAERISDIVDKRIGDPVGRDTDIVFKLLDAPPNVLWVRSWTEVELPMEIVSKIYLIDRKARSQKGFLHGRR
jgi:hypothetical protein